MILDEIKFDSRGLVPAIAQDYVSGEILMLAYMNRDTLAETFRTGKAVYWSRSRQERWMKGEHSGNLQLVKEILVDCDCDTLILKIEQIGNACHTGSHNCFYRKVRDGELVEDVSDASLSVLSRDYKTIVDRRDHPKEGSYTNYLFDKGIDKMLKKVGEESAEVIIASKNPDVSELRYEAADLLYHLMVVMVERGLTWEDLCREMESRREKRD